MNRRCILSVSAMTVLGLALSSGAAYPQQKSLKDQLVGTWLCVAVYGQRPDGSKQDNFGPNPSGLLMFDNTGRYSLQIVNPGRPKHESGDRLRMTPEEYAVIVKEGIAYSGTYTVDEANHTFNMVIERSMFEQWHDRTLPFEIKGDEMSYTQLPVQMNGVQIIPHLVWKRAH